jgi:hypothetical protein
MVGPLAGAGVLGGLVMADDAARACSEQPVVTGKMPGDSADDGALQAALGRRRTGTQRETCDRHRKSRGEQYRFHVKLLEDRSLLVANRPRQVQVPTLSGLHKNEAKLSHCKWKETLFRAT